MHIWRTAAARSEWVRTVGDAFQALADGLATADTAPLGEPLEHTSEPINDVERLIFRCYVSEMLLGALYRGEPIVRRDAVESILSAWPRIQRDAYPVSVLRRALSGNPRAMLAHDQHLAEQVRKRLEERYAEKILSRNLAQELHVSEVQMNRSFRRAFGMTIHRHLRMIRVRHGLDLVSTGIKIEAAGLAVGFRSKKDFYRAVQQLVGCTPAQFRSRMPQVLNHAHQ